MNEPHELPPLPLLLYDGECALCQGAVRWLLAHDPARRLYVTPLQGSTAAALRAAGVPVPAGADTVVFVLEVARGPRVLVRSRAILAACETIGYRPWFVRLLGWLPQSVADAAYRVVASTRYSIFGKARVCELPTEAEKGRFLP